MTTGEVYINDHDIGLTYSASLIADSYTNLLLPPGLKDFASNDLISQPGKQIFTGNIQPKDRDVQITFLIECNSLTDYLSSYNALIDALGTGIVQFKVAPLKTIYKIIATSYISLSSYRSGSIGSLVVKFNEPNPKDRIKL